MIYGAQRAQQVILTHPNHEHLLRVLEKTNSRLVAGERFGENVSEDGMVSDSSDSYPSNPNNESFDDDALLTDDEVNKQNQGGMFLYCAIELTNGNIYTPESTEPADLVQ